jgi:glycine cleavage system H lipoate-binding protein
MIERVCLAQMDTDVYKHENGSYEGFITLAEKAKRVSDAIQSLNGALKKINSEFKTKPSSLTSRKGIPQ